MVEVAEAPPIPSRTISLKDNENLFTPARYIVTLGESLVHHALKDTVDIKDGKTHTETFGFPAESEIGRNLSALTTNGETNTTDHTYLDISYRNIPSQTGDAKEIHIQGNNGFSLKLTHKKAETIEDSTLLIESSNGIDDINDDRLVDTFQRIRKGMTMLLKRQVPLNLRQNRPEFPSPSKRNPSRIKQLLKRILGRPQR